MVEYKYILIPMMLLIALVPVVNAITYDDFSTYGNGKFPDYTKWTSRIFNSLGSPSSISLGDGLVKISNKLVLNQKSIVLFNVNVFNGSNVSMPDLRTTSINITIHDLTLSTYKTSTSTCSAVRIVGLSNYTYSTASLELSYLGGKIPTILASNGILNNDTADCDDITGTVKYKNLTIMRTAGKGYISYKVNNSNKIYNVSTNYLKQTEPWYLQFVVSSRESGTPGNNASASFSKITMSPASTLSPIPQRYIDNFVDGVINSSMWADFWVDTATTEANSTLYMQSGSSVNTDYRSVTAVNNKTDLRSNTIYIPYLIRRASYSATVPMGACLAIISKENVSWFTSVAVTPTNLKNVILGPCTQSVSSLNEYNDLRISFNTSNNKVITTIGDNVTSSSKQLVINVTTLSGLDVTKPLYVGFFLYSDRSAGATQANITMRISDYLVNNTVISSSTPVNTIRKVFPHNNMISTTKNITLSALINNTHSNTNVSFFINGQKNKTRIIAAASNNTNVTFNRLFNNGRYNLTIQVQHWSTTVNSTQNSFTVNVTSLIVNNRLPANNTQFNTATINYNATVTNNGTSVTGRLFRNGVLYSIQTKGSGTYLFNWSNLAVTAGTHTYYMYFNNSNGVVSNHTPYIFYIDVTAPIIQARFVNRSIFYKYGSNFTGQFNISDTNLFSFNLSINGAQKYRKTGMTSVNYQINLSQNPNQFSDRVRNNLTLVVSDGHTAEELIDTYKFDIDSDSLDIASTQYGEDPDIPWLSKDAFIGKVVNYVLPIEDIFPSTRSNLQHISIAILDGSNSDRFTIDEGFDRYTFTYEPEVVQDSYQFIVNSDTELFVVNRPETIYKTWIVTGNKWVDFMLDNEPNAVVTIEKTGYSSAIATITGLEHPEKLSFHSIGELNTVTKVYSFFEYSNNAPGFRATDKEISYSPYNLSINRSSEVTTSARLIWNGTNYPNSSLTKTSSSTRDVYNKTLVTPRIINSKNYNNSWNYTVFNSVMSVSRVVKFNQKITEFNLTNCSLSPTRPGINFSVVDVDTGAGIGALRMNGIFSIWTHPSLSPISGNKVKNFSLAATTNTTTSVFRICVNTNKNLSIGWNMNYITSTAGYNIGQSLVSSLVGGTSPQNITNTTSRIYTLPLVSSAASVVINLIDRFGSNMVSYLVKMFLIRPGLPDTITTSFITDFKGEWVVSYNAVKAYRFDVYTPAQTQMIFSTGTTMITSNPFVIQVPNDQNDLASLQAMTRIASNVTCNAISKTCRFTWNDPIIKEGFFEVFRVNGWGKTLIFNDSTVASAGTLSYTVAENVSGNSYHAVGSIESNTNNSFYVVGRADLLAGGGIFSNLGDTSTIIFSAFFLVLTLSLLLIDIGPIGLFLGTFLGLLAGTILGIVPLSIAGLIAITCVLIAGIWFGRG